jgi:hypothetical protein
LLHYIDQHGDQEREFWLQLRLPRKKVKRARPESDRQRHDVATQGKWIRHKPERNHQEVLGRCERPVIGPQRLGKIW